MHLLGMLAACGPAVVDAPPHESLGFEVTGAATQPSVVVALPHGLLPSAGAIPETEGRRVLTLHVEGEEQPVVGRYVRTPDHLRFTPAFPLAKGHRYVARYLAPDGRVVQVTYALPAADARDQGPAVVGVWPGGSQVPENLLRLEVAFSRPMLGGPQVWDHLWLETETGGAPPQRVTGALRELELWDDDRTQLTVLLHPGRVKTGLATRAVLGPILTSGDRLHLVVAPGLEDVEGHPLEEGARSTWVVGPADAVCPDVAAWQVAVPAAGTRNPLRVVADEALDRAVLMSGVGVEVDGTPVGGRVEPDDDGRRLEWVPAEPWPQGLLTLVVDPDVADLAGNTVAGRLFDAPPGTAGTPPGPVRRPLAP